MNPLREKEEITLSQLPLFDRLFSDRFLFLETGPLKRFHALIFQLSDLVTVLRSIRFAFGNLIQLQDC